MELVTLTISIISLVLVWYAHNETSLNKTYEQRRMFIQRPRGFSELSCR